MRLMHNGSDDNASIISGDNTLKLSRIDNSTNGRKEKLFIVENQHIKGPTSPGHLKAKSNPFIQSKLKSLHSVTGNKIVPTNEPA